MTPFPALFLSLLAVTALANPIVHIRDSPITIPIAKVVALDGGLNLVARDRARARALVDSAMARKALKTVSTRQITPITVDSIATIYVANVSVGMPPTTFQLVVDTGSSNTWVGSRTPFNATSTTVATNNTVTVVYGSGYFVGDEFIDRVDLGSGLVIPQQLISVASVSDGFQRVDGILGLGPVGLTEGTVARTPTVPTVTDNLYAQKIMGSNMFGIDFNPTTTSELRTPVSNGRICYGGIDTSAITSPVTYTPITNAHPASDFWGIDQSITMNGTLILPQTAGIVDTGTSLILLATDAFNAYLALSGGFIDWNVGLIRLSPEQFAALKPLDFVINGVTFSLSPNAQAWPRQLNTALGGNVNSVYLIVADLGTPTGEGFDFINGFAFLERFYSVYDTTNHQVGFATTTATNATTN